MQVVKKLFFQDLTVGFMQRRGCTITGRYNVENLIAKKKK